MRHNNFPQNAPTKARWRMLSAFRRNNIVIVGKIISFSERYGYTVDIDGIKANLDKTILRLFFENLLTAPRSQVFNLLKI